MTRPAENTRRNLIESATAVFAENGYERSSVREITSRAQANQAAVTYHFGGKEGLYQEVLKSALARLQEAMTEEEAPSPGTDRDALVKSFVRRQLAALLSRDRLAAPLRIFGWESVAPTPAYLKFLSEQTIPMVAQAETLVRLYLPPNALAEQVAVATIWLTQQAAPFLRHSEALARPPLSLKVSRAYVDRLAAQLGAMAAKGLSALGE